MSVVLPAALIGMSLIAVALLLGPLMLRRRGAAARDAYNLAVYRDQLAEIDRDVGRGIIEPVEAEAARAEIGRRILALTTSPEAMAPGSRRPLAVTTVAVILLPLAALALYWQLGSPELPDQPFAARPQPAATARGDIDIDTALRQVKEHLQQHPDDLKGWKVLGRTLFGLGRFADAAEAYRHAVELSHRQPEILGDYGQALVLAANGTVTPAAKDAFEAARSDPDNAPRARFYLALARLQAGDATGALQDWVDLEAESPADAAWLPMLRERIAATAKTLGLDAATLTTSTGAPRKAPPLPEPPAAK